MVDNPPVLAPGKPKPPQPSVESATVDAAVELAILKQRVDDQEKLLREKDSRISDVQKAVSYSFRAVRTD